LHCGRKYNCNIVCEEYITATGCLNTILFNLTLQFLNVMKVIEKRQYYKKYKCVRMTNATVQSSDTCLCFSVSKEETSSQFAHPCLFPC
jgi:hypothetical protein